MLKEGGARELECRVDVRAWVMMTAITAISSRPSMSKEMSRRDVEGEKRK